jgi:hypothetical protein
MDVPHKKYWAGSPGSKDDFGGPIHETFYDGKTMQGPWAIMNASNWRLHGCQKLGTGYGQKYEKQDDGRWLKTAG